MSDTTTMLYMPLGEIHAPAWNPRQHIDEEGLEELRQSVESIGVIQPLLVRPVNGQIELVAGSRRLEAAKRAELAEVPVVVRDLDDLAAAQVAVAENIQREEMPPLDEAGAYQHLLDVGEPVNAISRALGVTVNRVRRRLRLLALSEPVRQALTDRQITIDHADTMTRVPVEQQGAALNQCFHQLYEGSYAARDSPFETAPVRRLKDWVEQNVVVSLDPEVVEDYFPELIADDEVPAPAAVPTLLKLSDQYNPSPDTKDQGLIERARWIEIGDGYYCSKEECDNVQEGVIVHGGRIRRLRCCATPGCPVHRPPAPKAERPSGPRHDYAAEERRRKDLEKRWNAEKASVFKAFAEHVADLELTDELVRRVMSLDAGERFLQKAFGKDWESSADNIGQVLACNAVARAGWSREEFARVTKEWGFKMPRRPPAKRKAAAKKKTRAKKTTRKRAASKPAATPAADAGGEA